MYYIDAKHIIRWFLGDIPKQAAVVEKLLRDSPSESLVVLPVTIAEVTYVLRAKTYNHQQIHDVLAAFFSYVSVRAVSEDTRRAVQLFAETSLDFEDCYLIAKAVNHSTEIATFDKQLLKALQQLRP